MTNRVTPENITELKENEIFVFGSNSKGEHKAGAAKLANEKFGAETGIGEGLTGQCYADLRIGNFIKGTANRKISESKVFSVYNETFCDIDRGNGIFEPIPLTEEWLEKFGFESDRIGGGSRYFLQVNDRFRFFYLTRLKVYFYDTSTEIDIKYVHQLQNLYFALIGEELIIKTKTT